MQFTRETTDANVVRAWQTGALRVGEEWLHGHVILAANLIIRDWPVTVPELLVLEDLAPAVELDPEIILLGTGASLVFPASRITAALAAQRIGLEVMDTPAACRTFNVLLAEQRRVVAALFNPPPPSTR